MKAPSRLYEGSIKALVRLYQGSIKALSRLQVSEKYTRPGKQLVFELGANDGSWIADFCAKNPDFEPHIFEPQPRFANALSAIAATYKVLRYMCIEP